MKKKLIILVILLTLFSTFLLSDTIYLRSGEKSVGYIENFNLVRFLVVGEREKFEVPLRNVTSVLLAGEEKVEYGLKLTDGSIFPDAKLFSIRDELFIFDFDGGRIEINDRRVISGFSVNTKQTIYDNKTDWSNVFFELYDGEKFTARLNSIKSNEYRITTPYGSFIENANNISRVVPYRGVLDYGIHLVNGLKIKSIEEFSMQKVIVHFDGGKITLNDPSYITGINYFEHPIKEAEQSKILLKNNSVFVGEIILFLNNELTLKKDQRILNIPMNDIQEIRNIFVAKDYASFVSHKKDMILIENSTFYMGDEYGDLPYYAGPINQITFNYDFYVSKKPVTFNQYDYFCEDTGREKPRDEGWGRDNRPVINVNWYDAIAYANWLSQQHGFPKAYDSRGNLIDKYGNITTDVSKVEGYRLPTEAEWEYAARGGKYSNGYLYSGSHNPTEVSWFSYNSENKTHPVASKAPNELGIYDMSGNVWEWTTDYWIDHTSSRINPHVALGSQRILKGGSWYHNATFLRVAHRLAAHPTTSYSVYGFRLVRTFK